MLTLPSLLPRQVALVMLALSATPLGLALLSQYGFGLHPCELCLWQRIPYVALIAVAVLLLIWPRYLRLGIGISALLWLSEAALAFYHVGVEQGWWQSSTGCTAQTDALMTLEELRASILNSPLVPCDQPELVVLGLSMAGWNGLYSLLMVTISVIYLRRMSANYAQEG